jgi:N-acyl-D-amino-acid deacylase
MTYDLKIVGGSIVDGTGRERFRGDIGVKDGRIVAIGEATGKGEQTIDAGGLVVAPGFVDIHTHYDAQIMWDRMLSISPWHGVTTVVMGNCGFGVAPTRPDHRNLILRTLEKVEGMSVEALEAGLGPTWPFESFPQYLDEIERRGSAINVGVLIGHTPVRFYVMGEEAIERPARPEELARMRELVREALVAGAVGFATSKASTHVGYGGKPVPSRAAEVSEIISLAKVLGEVGSGIFQATVGKELFLEEFAEITRATGRPVTWTALLTGLSLGAGDHREQLRRSEELAAEGLPIFPQVTPRALMFDYQLKQPFLFEPMSLFKPVAAADQEGKRRIYADPSFRNAFADLMERSARVAFRSAFAKTIISQFSPDPKLEERLLVEVSREREVKPTDLLLDLALATNLDARFRMPVANHDEAEVEGLLKSACTVIGLSDAGAHASQLCDACLPTYLLGHWVREKAAFSLEEAVRMLTSRPAEVFGLSDRGVIALGMPADLVVFDPVTVGSGKIRRVFDLPSGADRLVSDAAGVEAVVVNGTVVRQSNRDLLNHSASVMPGRLLRRGRASA